MKPLRVFLPLSIILLTCLAYDTSADLRPYKHPDLDLQFTAAEGWLHQPRPGDEGTHERMDPETGIHVLMWHTTSQQSPERYLTKMAHMMDVDPDVEKKVHTIDGRDFRVLDTTGRIDGRSVNTLLAVTASGRSPRHPLEHMLYIVQIWCPADDHARLAGRMDQLLAGVRITDRVVTEDGVLWLYPETYTSPPDLPSPWQAPDGETYVTVCTQVGTYALVPVTVENGAPNAYAENEWDKGRQLAVDANDFPTLARTGLHSEEELRHTETITGRAVAAITADAKPGQASRSGFLAADENLIPVLKADNQLVRSLGLTHPDLARPLFQIFNVILRDLELWRRRVVPVHNVTTVLYAGHEIHLKAEGGKGWQESIFKDEVLGYWSIVLQRELTYLEKKYLAERYGQLGQEKLDELTTMLTEIQTGEMVPFYIMRYGFYEGHVFYRADPLAIAHMFRLLDLSEIDAATGGGLYGALTRHHTTADGD